MAGSDVAERNFRLPAGFVPARVLEEVAASDLVALLPDRIEEHGGETVAAFREDTAELRKLLGDAGIAVDLAAPPDSQLATYEEHAADWILPMILAVPPSVVAGVIANWIWAKLGSDAHDTTVHYREGHIASDGTVDVKEIIGPGDQVARILQEQGGSPGPGGPQS